MIFSITNSGSFTKLLKTSHKVDTHRSEKKYPDSGDFHWPRGMSIVAVIQQKYRYHFWNKIAFSMQKF